jgi:hypothetical protein
MYSRFAAKVRHVPPGHALLVPTRLSCPRYRKTGEQELVPTDSVKREKVLRRADYSGVAAPITHSTRLRLAQGRLLTLLCGVAAVDSQHLARNVGRLIRSQEQRCLSRLGWLGGPAKRDNIGCQILD